MDGDNVPQLFSTRAIAHGRAEHDDGSRYAEAIVTEEKFGRFYNSRDPEVDAIGLGVCLYSLKEVSIKDGTFKAKARVQLKWRVDGIDRICNKSDSFRTMLFTSHSEMSECLSGFNLIKITPNVDIEPIDLLLPQFSTNQVDGAFEQWYAYLDANDAHDVVTLQYVEIGTFAMLDFDAGLFPFDVQSVDFKFRLFDTERFANRYFQPLENPDGTHYQKVFKMDVSLHDFMITKPTLLVMRTRKKELDGACEFVISPQLRRRSSYYLRHILFRLTLVSTLSLGAYAVPVTNIELRSSVFLTVLLTAVTFSFTIQEDLPRLSRYTYMDVIVYGHFLLIVAVATESFILVYLAVEGLMTSDELKTIDTLFAYVLVAFWVLYNAVIIAVFAWHNIKLSALEDDMIGTNSDKQLKLALRRFHSKGDRQIQVAPRDLAINVERAESI